MNKIEKAKELIQLLYDTPDGSVGGYGHIVFDDGNVEDGFITGCIEDAINERYGDICQETRFASLAALVHFLTLSVDERESIFYEE